jgi:hypothetical protein
MKIFKYILLYNNFYTVISMNDKQYVYNNSYEKYFIHFDEIFIFDDNNNIQLNPQMYDYNVGFYTTINDLIDIKNLFKHNKKIYDIIDNYLNSNKYDSRTFVTLSENTIWQKDLNRIQLSKLNEWLRKRLSNYYFDGLLAKQIYLELPQKYDPKEMIKMTHKSFNIETSATLQCKTHNTKIMDNQFDKEFILQLKNEVLDKINTLGLSLE